MKCPKCGGLTLVRQVRDSSARRRRICRKCAFIFHTQEVLVEPLPHGGDRRSEQFTQQAQEGIK